MILSGDPNRTRIFCAQADEGHRGRVRPVGRGGDVPAVLRGDDARAAGEPGRHPDHPGGAHPRPPLQLVHDAREGVQDSGMVTEKWA